MTRASTISALAIPILALGVSISSAMAGSPTQSLNPAGDFEFVATSAPAYARINAAAVLLGDGRVLVIGGYDTATSEIWDPATGSWITSGSMAGPREGATATLLADGRVLVVGGGVGTAEVWDASEGTFSVAGDLPAGLPRADVPVSEDGESHTLLADGRTLIAGGLVKVDPDCHPLCSVVPTEKASLSDRATGIDEPLTPMTQPRAGHVAVLLHDGRVLLVGSHTHSDLDRTAEVFQPRAAPTP